MSSYAFFGLQIVLPVIGASSRLLDAVRERATDQRLHQKRAFWRKVSDAASQNLRADQTGRLLGYWDLVRGDGAEREHETWVSELEALSSKRPSDLGAIELSTLPPAPFGEQTFFVLSLSFLVTAGSPADSTLGELCDKAESEWFRTATFAELIEGVPRLDFGYVQADAVYLYPGPTSHGLLREAFEEAGYEYLRRLS